MSNLISYELSAADLQAMIDALGVIRNKLNTFAVGLTPRQRKVLPKMHEGRKPFVKKAIQYGVGEPKIVPPFVSLTETQKDVKLFEDLEIIYRLTNRINEAVSDTMIAAGSDAYVTALSIYNSSKRASTMAVLGVDEIVADLKVLFEEQGNFNDETETPQ